MTDPAVVAELRSLRQTLLTLCQYIGPHLSRDQMCKRYGVSRNTLARRIESGHVPRPGADGKWLLAEVVDWEARQSGLQTPSEI